MARCILQFKDCEDYANIEATDIFENGEYIKVFNDNNLVGIFAIESIKSVYLSKQKENNNG